ncbi:hypothetical protein [Ferrimonas pelagia]|uniref:GGDEF domain-containing protein n=1 Tax=Ferrimonas pelagia TaxID=1177826 RepID=A0ABP9EX70_9GAMM
MLTLLFPFTSFAQPPTLQPLMTAIAAFDTNRADQLSRQWQPSVEAAPPNWQLHWHLLQCDRARLASEPTTIRDHLHQIERLRADQPQLNGIGYVRLCEAAALSIEQDVSNALIQFADAIELGNRAGDPGLQYISHIRRANLLADDGQYSAALADLSAALHLRQPAPSYTLLGSHPAMLDFSLARTFYYLRNPARTDDAMAQALAKVAPNSPLNWFIRFNYANMLGQQQRLEESQQQLAQLGDNPPTLGEQDDGYVHYFKALNAFGLGEYQLALTEARAAADTFVLAELQPQYSRARHVQGQALLMLDQEEEGWKTIGQAEQAMKLQGDLNNLAKMSAWIAHYHYSKEAYLPAYLALQDQLKYQREYDAELSQQALSEQQQSLGQQMDRHRQQLANTAEAHYQSQQALLFWQGLTGLFGVLLLALGLRRLWPDNETPVPIDPTIDSRSYLAQQIRNAKACGDPLPVILLRLSADAAMDELSALLKQDLRRGDELLQIDATDHVLLLPWATDGELGWRIDALPRQLASIGLSHCAIGKARVHSFDDVDSLMVRLECNLTSHGLRRKRQAGDEPHHTRSAAIVTHSPST